MIVGIELFPKADSTYVWAIILEGEELRILEQRSFAALVPASNSIEQTSAKLCVFQIQFGGGHQFFGLNINLQ